MNKGYFVGGSADGQTYALPTFIREYKFMVVSPMEVLGAVDSERLPKPKLEVETYHASASWDTDEDVEILYVYSWRSER